MERLLRCLAWTETHRLATVGILALLWCFTMVWTVRLAVSSLMGWSFFVIVLACVLFFQDKGARHRSRIGDHG